MNTVANNDVTFVTSCAIIYDDNDCEKLSINNHTKDTNWRIQHFRELAKTEIKICLYGCKKSIELLKTLENEFPENVKLMELTWEDTFTYKLCESFNKINDESVNFLPNVRNHVKDTSKYMTLINSKMDFVHDAMQQNPWCSTAFAWIDFSIFYVFQDKEACSQQLKQMYRHFTQSIEITCNEIGENNEKFVMEDLDHCDKRQHSVLGDNGCNVCRPPSRLNNECIYVPGCWDKLRNANVHYVLNNICWRFCGGFFVGTKHSLTRFCEIYFEEFPKFLKIHNKLVWEVNIWAWLELLREELNITWYLGDHNDSILNIPYHHIASK